jgi:6-phosphofructokinase 1
VPASPADSVYCWHLARNAVHAAMAGNTNMAIGRWHGHFVHVPMPLATRFRKQVNVEGDLWAAVVESTGQPYSFERMPASAELGSAPASERQSQAS